MSALKLINSKISHIVYIWALFLFLSLWGKSWFNLTSKKFFYHKKVLGMPISLQKNLLNFCKDWVLFLLQFNGGKLHGIIFLWSLLIMKFWTAKKICKRIRSCWKKLFRPRQQNRFFDYMAGRRHAYLLAEIKKMISSIMKS